MPFFFRFVDFRWYTPLHSAMQGCTEALQHFDVRGKHCHVVHQTLGRCMSIFRSKGSGCNRNAEMHDTRFVEPIRSHETVFSRTCSSRMSSVLSKHGRRQTSFVVTLLSLWQFTQLPCSVFLQDQYCERRPPRQHR